jgi:hypothetical protein
MMNRIHSLTHTCTGLSPTLHWNPISHPPIPTNFAKHRKKKLRGSLFRCFGLISVWGWSWVERLVDHEFTGLGGHLAAQPRLFVIGAASQHTWLPPNYE